MIHSFSVVQFGFIALTLIFLGWFLILVYRSARRIGLSEKDIMKTAWGLGIGLIVWLAVLSIGGISGFFGDFTAMPPRMLIVVLIPLITIIWIITRPATQALITGIPPAQILYMQSFRIVVELLLWMLFLQNLLPERMTFEGSNWDIIAGVTGPVVGFLFSRNHLSPHFVKVWNVVGLLLLINIVTIAILSAPLPIRVFMDDPANTIVMTFPAIWLPGFLVPLAYTLHIISWKQMSLQKQTSRPTV
jgi:hypothetical protein